MPGTLSVPLRISSAHMPLDRILGETSGTGSVALGGTLNRSFNLPFNDKVNPFVHQYHPDHDNKNARFNTYNTAAESDESYTVDRAVSFSFANTPPAGVPATGYGTTVPAGDYTEVIDGIHKDPLTVTGEFIFRRVNEIGEITITP